MLRAFTYENGKARRLADTEPLRSAVWIDLELPSPGEIARVESATGLILPPKAAIDEIEVSSRLSARDGVLTLSLPMITLTEGPRTVSGGFILARDRLVTLRFAPSRTFDNAVDRLPETKGGVPCGGHILVGLLEAIVDRQADALEQVRADMDAISHRIFAMGVQQEGGRKTEDLLLRRTLGELGQHGDLISHVRETQLGAARIAPYVEEMTKEWMPEELRARLKTIHDDVVSLNDFNTHLNDKLQFLLDATLGFINIAQNNVMKVMTIASVVGIPPVMIAGIYGMNFKNIPELDWAWGYPYAWAAILVTTLIPLAIFRWRKWI